ncbi:MAG: L-seryl-tRNA(Sec) selenium transferase [Synergistaceae bacterium]
MKTHIQEEMRKIPSMDKILSLPWITQFEESLGRDTVKGSISVLLNAEKESVIKDLDKHVNLEEIYERIREFLKRKGTPTLKQVVNATGVVVHTNLGRSLLADEAIDNVAKIAANYSTLEYSPENGSRGHRNNHVEWLICQLTGAEAALVVNNNAAAVILALSALSKGKEAIVSRGELVEIGGSFRIPDIMALSGTEMVEVGTTNRTHLKDYANAITEETKLLLKIHPSNYKITGFSSSVPREELATLAHNNNVIFMEDLGSGMLVDLSSVCLSDDPTVSESLMSGVDLVTFSGDKLLGGPQIGVLVGKKEIIDLLRTYPLLRALRVDKMTLCAFETTLRLYLKGDVNKIPTISMVMETAEELKSRANLLLRKMKKEIKKININFNFQLDIVETRDTVGGGSFPQSVLKGYGVSLYAPSLGSSGNIAQSLRMMDTPIIAGASEDKVVFHVRTLRKKDEIFIIDSLLKLLKGRNEFADGRDYKE